MSLSKDQVNELIQLVTAAEADSLDCDGCFAHLAEFAELELAHKEIPDALKAVETHLRQCKCCMYEFQMLMNALRALEGE